VLPGVTAALVDATLNIGVHEPGDLPWFTIAYSTNATNRPRGGRGGHDRGAHASGRKSTMDSRRLAEILDDAAETRQLLTVLRRLEEVPSLLGATSHLLTVARHP
jgi:hypothetical protein